MSAQSTPLLTVNDLVVSFKKGRQVVQAVAGISFEVFEGETLGLVGESGCGKSTTGRAIVRIEEPTSGEVAVEGRQLTGLGRSDLRKARTSIQMIFQDPVSSLNPRRRVKDIVAEPLDIWKTAEGAERETWWNTVILVDQPIQAVYQDRTSRLIPVVVMDIIKD